jgi:hypothetical protein
VDDSGDEGRVGGFLRGIIAEKIADPCCRRGLKIGGIAGGIVGLILGSLTIVAWILAYNWRAHDPEPWLQLKNIIQTVKVCGGTTLGGVIVGCLMGVVAGRLMREKGGFVPVVVGAGTLGGVLGAVIGLGEGFVGFVFFYMAIVQIFY